MAIYDEIESKGLYGGVKTGAPLSLEESQNLGLPQLNPLQDELERAYEKHVTNNPDQAAARIWTAERVGIPQWIQDRDEMYLKEAETRLALLEKKSPDWNRMVAFSPATSKFLSYDDVMASAYDDVDNLAAMEEEAKRAARVKKNLNGLLQRGASGRTAIMRKLKADIKPSDIVLNAGTTDPEKGTGSPLGRDADTFAPGAIRGRDTDISQFKNPFTALGKGLEDADRKINDFISATSPGEGWVEGWAEGFEMSELGKAASRLFDAEAAGAPRNEAKWVALDKRKIALGRNEPENLRDYLLFATAKFGGQQQSGIERTIGLSAGMLAIAGLMALTAPISVPGAMLATAGTAAAATVGAGITAGSLVNMGRALGMGMQVYETERGLDILERRMLRDKDNNYISDEAVMAGSTTTGVANAIWEIFQWNMFLGSFGKTPAGRKVVDKVLPKVAAQIGKMPSVARTVGRIGTQFVVSDFLESFTEVLQDAGPLAITELQKHALLGGHDAISMGEAMNRLTDTFRQSTLDFALISAIGPVVGGIRGDHHIELARKEMEAHQVQRMDSNMGNFKARIGASKLLQRIPNMSKDFANELLDGADARTVYVPATSVQQMFQDGLIEGVEQEDAASWAQDTLGVDPEDFRASLEGGPDLEIEAIKLFDGVPDKAQDAIRKSMRFAADGMTLGEAEAMGERITKVRQGDLFNVAYELEREMSEASSAHKVFESMRLQMEAQGMDPEIAANTAWMASRMYIPMARMWNEKRTSQDLITPEDVAEMFPISFTQNDDGSMGMYFQALGEKGARNYDAAFATIKLDNLAIAKEKLTAGEDPQKIKMAFGWELGADGKWRMETKDDLRLKAKPGTKEWRDLFLHKEKYGPARHALLSEVISFDELFTAYPDMADMKVFVDLDDDTTSGYYSERENAIHLSYKTGNNPVEVFHTLTHEIQHAIQRREGFARGGSPDSFIDDFYETKQYKDAEEVFSLYSNLKYLPKFFNYLDFNKRGRGIISPTGIYLRPWDEQYKEFADEKKLKEDFDQFKEDIKDIEVDGEKLFDKLLRQYEEYDKKLIEYEKKYDSDLHTYIRKDSELSKQYALEQYYRLAGEVEARNTETRLGMPSSERYATLMADTEDVSREDQIILNRMLRKAELAEELRYFQAAPVNIQSQIQAEFEKNVDAVISNKYNSEDSLLLGATPEVFKQIGVADLPIVMGQKHIYSTSVSEVQAKKDSRYVKGINYHNMGKDNIKKLYGLISDPVMIITSDTRPDDSIVVLVNMDKNGEKVIAPVVVEGFGKNKGLTIDASAVTSFLNKKNVLTKLVSDAVEKEKNGKVGIYYMDKKNSPLLLLQAGVQFSALGMQPDGLVHSLSDPMSPVKTKLSDITETKQFKRFFGDWKKNPKKASKVVGKDGRPLVVYHGTKEAFSEFRRDKLGSRENAFFFTSNKESAMEYGADVMPVYLNARRFVRLDENYRDAEGREYDVDSAEFRRKYDGYSVNEGTDYDEFVVFRPNQIKSVDNIGTFDTSDPNIYRQTSDGQHRGSITFPRQAGQPIRISWSKNADASTVIHELAHFYLWQLRQFRSTPSVATGRYGRRATDDLGLISDWWSEDAQQITDWIRKQAGMSEMVKAGATEDNFINWINSGMERESEQGKAFDTAAHEFFARGFEAYMREGKAPTAELQSVFRRFKKWLTEIYKSLTELNVELSDDVRAVYDRMLASEEAIEQFKAELEIEELLRSEEDNIPDDYPFDKEDPFEAAKERLLGILMDEISPENRKKMLARADEIRPRIAAEVSTEQGWMTINMYEENPDRRISESEILDRYGEAVISQLSPAVMDPDGISVEIAAKDMGYGSADELINDLTGKTSLQAEIDARVKAQIEREFASIINDPAKLDAAAEAAWYEGEEHSDDLAADMVVPMSEYAELYGESEQAAAEQESPRERRKVINWIRNHGGILYSSVAQEFGDERARELVRRVGPGLLSKTGFGLDSLAQEMSGNGFMIESDEDLFKILLEGEDARKDPLEEAKEQGRAEALQEVKTKRALEKMIAVEKKRLEKEIKSKYNEQIKGVKSAAETAAGNIVGSMTIEKLKDTARYMRAEKEARRKADAALRKNDEIEFRRWRERELMQHMIVKQMYRHQRQAEGIRSWLERYAKRTNTQTFGMTPNFVEQVDALLTRFDIRKTRSLTAKQRAMVGEAPSLDNFVREMDAEGTPILIDDWILGLQEKRHYTQLMLWQFKEVQNAVKNIVTVGRQEKQTIALMQNEKLSDIANKIYNAAKGFYGDKVTGEKLLDPEEIKKNIIALAGGALSSIETVEAMCRALDGYMDMGPAQKYIFQPIRAAMTRETLELNRVFALARDIHKEAYGGAKVDNWSKTFDGIYKYKEVTLPDGKVKYVPTDQKLTLTREMAISAVLNMGNEGNRSRLMTGWGWTSENMAEVLDTLDEQDIKYVQGIWNLVESLWPQVKKVHQLMTGLTLEKVEATPLQTKYGKITGGYYPIVTDLRYSTQAAAQSEVETVLASATLNHAHSYTKSGHRKARAVDVEGRPPLLSLSVLDNHLANVIHDFEVAPALRDARKILKYPLVETTIDEVLGKKRRTHINKWLNDVASNTKNNGIALSDTDRYANKLISGTAMFTLGANMGGALMQPLGYFALAHRIGAVRTARAIINGLKDNRALYEFVLEKSDFMREQYRGQNVEVRRLRENWSSQSEGLKWWQDRMLDIYPMLQNLCNVPGWAEAYKMGIEKYGGNDADAIAYADSVIRQTQSASGLADLTTFERSGTWQRWVSMFYSWFRVMYQMQNEALMKTIYGHGLKGRFGDLASYAFYILVAQNVAEALLRGYGPDEDDDDDGEAEKWVKWTAKQAFLSPLSTVPIVRDLARGAEIGRYTFSPAEASIRSIYKLIQAAGKFIKAEPEERDLEPLVWSGAEVVGYGTGLPNRAMLRAAKALWELYNEDEAIPWAYVILGGGFRPKK